jgi:hypothetical protein
MHTRLERRLISLGTLLIATAVTLAGCSSTRTLTRAATSGQPGATAAATRKKPPLEGLLDMGVQTPYQTGQPFPVTDPSTLDSYAGAFAGIVVNESWSQLEPAPGIERWQPLDQSLAAVAAWNRRHASTPLGVKLRIFAGRSAPEWVKTRSGTVTILVHGQPATIGRWWTPPFEAAWHAFQLALAARYDADPLVQQVSVSSCSSSTGEPFVVSGAHLSQVNLAKAGWSPAAEEQCLSRALSDYSGWKRTPVTFAFNPLPTRHGPDSTFMDEMMRDCASSAAHGGPTCIVGNNDLSPEIASTRYSGPAVSEIARLENSATPPVVYFQTSGARLGCQTIATGLGYHARSIELWPPRGSYRGFSVESAATLRRWNRAVRGGEQLRC